MTQADEEELLRLTAILEALHSRLTDEPNAKEAVQKAALALSVCFIHGLRPEVERLYAASDQTLSAPERARLRELGINPDSWTD